MWHALVEVTQQNEASGDIVLIDHLIGAVVELNLPPAFLERIQEAVAEAIQRAWRHEKKGAVHLTVAAQVPDGRAGQIAQSWGFFLVEKCLEHTADRRIEVLLYPERY